MDQKKKGYNPPIAFTGRADASKLPIQQHELTTRIKIDAKGVQKVRRNCWMCVGRLRYMPNADPREAKAMARLRFTYCPDCIGEPTLCEECFMKSHDRNPEANFENVKIAGDVVAEDISYRSKGQYNRHIMQKAALEGVQPEMKPLDQHELITRYKDGQEWRKTCRSCYNKLRRKNCPKTIFYCPDCENQPSLCPECFKETHHGNTNN